MSAQASLLEPSLSASGTDGGRRSALKKKRDRERSTSGGSGNCCSKNTSLESGKGKKSKRDLREKPAQEIEPHVVAQPHGRKVSETAGRGQL